VRTRFHQSLDELKEKLLVMAGFSAQSIQRSVEAYRTRDAELVDLVRRSETAINRLEREIDGTALDLLAMEQPMAVDLRFILSVIRINADLERVGDLGVNIAIRAGEMNTLQPVDLPVDIPRIGTLAAAMIRKAIEAFIDGDVDLAENVLTLDDEIDKLNTSAFHALSGVIREQPMYTTQALNAMLISRNLERVGDHATNIAEDVIFWVKGRDIRHNMSAA
jgi:phosphate transport system protein